MAVEGNISRSPQLQEEHPVHSLEADPADPSDETSVADEGEWSLLHELCE